MAVYKTLTASLFCSVTRYRGFSDFFSINHWTAHVIRVVLRGKIRESRMYDEIVIRPVVTRAQCRPNNSFNFKPIPICSTTIKLQVPSVKILQCLIITYTWPENAIFCKHSRGCIQFQRAYLRIWELTNK